MGALNKSLNTAKRDKFDEFYTKFIDIEKELIHYKEHFKGKIVFCNCDDPEFSNFYFYFAKNFRKLGLKKLITTHFEKSKPSYKLEIINDHYKDGIISERNTIKTPLKQNGDFRSDEAIALLKEADIVVTNPPFSLLREFIVQLVKFKKKFLILGSVNAVTYKEIFPLFRDNKIWYGSSIKSGDTEFYVPDHYPLNASGCGIDKEGRKFIKVKGIRWLTNLNTSKQEDFIELKNSYDPKEYKKYENYDAINVSQTKKIPVDYDGLMGVPITFLDKYNPSQFEIIMLANGNARTNTPSDILQVVKYRQHSEDRGGVGIIDGKRVYARLIIRKRQVHA